MNKVASERDCLYFMSHVCPLLHCKTRQRKLDFYEIQEGVMPPCLVQISHKKIAAQHGS